MPSTSDNSNSSTPASGAEVESSSADIHSLPLASWVKDYMEEKGLGDFDEMMKDIKIPAVYVRAVNSYVEVTKKGRENAEKNLDGVMRRIAAAERVIDKKVEAFHTLIDALEKRVEAFQTLVDGQAALIVELYLAAGRR